MGAVTKLPVFASSKALRDVMTEHALVIQGLARYVPLSCAQAAICYADYAVYSVQFAAKSGVITDPQLYRSVPKPATFPKGWTWKPRNVRTDLIRATALLIGEIEKLDAAQPDTPALPADH